VAWCLQWLQHILCVVHSIKVGCPCVSIPVRLQVLPHPINTQVPLALPGAPAEAASALEDQLLLQGLLTAHVTARKLQYNGSFVALSFQESPCSQRTSQHVCHARAVTVVFHVLRCLFRHHCAFVGCSARAVMCCCISPGMTALLKGRAPPRGRMTAQPLDTLFPCLLCRIPSVLLMHSPSSCVITSARTVSTSSGSACDAEGVSAELEASKVCADRLAIKTFRDYVAPLLT
jgi:hypothetical protein